MNFSPLWLIQHSELSYSRFGSLEHFMAFLPCLGGVDTFDGHHARNNDEPEQPSERIGCPFCTMVRPFCKMVAFITLGKLQFYHFAERSTVLQNVRPFCRTVDMAPILQNGTPILQNGRFTTLVLTDIYLPLG